MNKFIEKIRYYLQIVWKVVNTEQFLVNFALLPLLWTWLPVLTFRGSNSNVKKYTLFSGILTFYFFGIIILSWIISWIPVVGDLLGNIVHLVGILFYVGFLGYFIVTLYRKIPQKTFIVEPVYNRIKSFL